MLSTAIQTVTNTINGYQQAQNKKRAVINTAVGRFTAYRVFGDLSRFPQMVYLTDGCHLWIRARSRGRWTCPFATECP